MWIRLAIVVLLAAGTAGARRESAFVVIVHPSNHFASLSRLKISFLYLRKVSRWPWGAEAEPIDFSDRALREEFTQEVLRMNGEELAAYWIDQRQARGVVPPRELPNASRVKAWVASHAGAIAYIPRHDLDETVKVLEVEP